MNSTSSNSSGNFGLSTFSSKALLILVRAIIKNFIYTIFSLLLYIIYYYSILITKKLIVLILIVLLLEV